MYLAQTLCVEEAAVGTSDPSREVVLRLGRELVDRPWLVAVVDEDVGDDNEEAVGSKTITNLLHLRTLVLKAENVVDDNDGMGSLQQSVRIKPSYTQIHHRLCLL